jgi:hypothetical protein
MEQLLFCQGQSTPVLNTLKQREREKFWTLHAEILFVSRKRVNHVHILDRKPEWRPKWSGPKIRVEVVDDTESIKDIIPHLLSLVAVLHDVLHGIPDLTLPRGAMY